METKSTIKILDEKGIDKDNFEEVDNEVPDIIEEPANKTSEAILWIIDNQLGRRNLVPYDRVRLNLRKEKILKPIAKENQIRKSGVVGKKSSQQYEKNKTRTKIAKVSKVSHDTVAKVKFIESKANKETKKKLSKGEETIWVKTWRRFWLVRFVKWFVRRLK